VARDEVLRAEMLMLIPPGADDSTFQERMETTLFPWA